MDTLVKTLQTANQDLNIFQDTDGIYYVKYQSKSSRVSGFVLASTDNMKTWKKLDSAIAYLTKNFDLVYA